MWFSLFGWRTCNRFWGDWRSLVHLLISNINSFDGVLLWFDILKLESLLQRLLIEIWKDIVGISKILGLLTKSWLKTGYWGLQLGLFGCNLLNRVFWRTKLLLMLNSLRYEIHLTWTLRFVSLLHKFLWKLFRLLFSWFCGRLLLLQSFVFTFKLSSFGLHGNFLLFECFDFLTGLLRG